MSRQGLQTLVMTAIVDESCRRALLAGAIPIDAGFDLSADEIAYLRAISATTLEDWAAAVHRHFYGEDLCAANPSPGNDSPPLLAERVGRRIILAREKARR